MFETIKIIAKNLDKAMTGPSSVVSKTNPPSVVSKTNPPSVVSKTNPPSVVSKTKLLTLPEVVQQYVSHNNDILDNDFTNTDNKIKKYKKIIELLVTNKTDGYKNEEEIYNTKIKEFQQKVKALQLQKATKIKQTEIRKIGYQKIDLSFLSIKKLSKNGLPHYCPAFSVHKYINLEFLNCSIIVDKKEIRTWPDTKEDTTYLFIFKYLVKGFSDKINLNTLEIFPHGGASYSAATKLTEVNTEIDSDFIGIIPETTKQKIDQANKIFNKGCYSNCSIFLIKECHEWNKEIITKDPLIIGIIGEQAYLIDNFDCTNLETYVKKEFTG